METYSPSHSTRARVHTGEFTMAACRMGLRPGPGCALDEYTLFTYLLCHSHCLSLTSKLRNKVYAIDFCMAFCRLFVMLINDNRIGGTIFCEEAKIGN